MGRRSINTTKSGKYMNPTDQARKEARKKELKKNKKQRQMVRQAVLKGKDPIQIIAEMEKIDSMEYNVLQPAPLNEKVLKDKRRKLRETLDRVLKLYQKEDPEKWEEVKRIETEYEKRRLNLVTYSEAVRHAQQVQVDEIPLPLAGGIPLPDSVTTPAGILRKRSAYSPPRLSSLPLTPLSMDHQVITKRPPGVPPGPPPPLSSDEEDDVQAPDEKIRRTTIRFAEKDSDEESDDEMIKDPIGLQQSMPHPPALIRNEDMGPGMIPPPSLPAPTGQLPIGLPPARPLGVLGMRPPGPPPGLPPRLLPPIRLPPGPPPGLPRVLPPRLTPNVLTAAPQLIRKDAPNQISLSKGPTIEAKAQIRNLSADVTRFVPTALRVKRTEERKVGTSQSVGLTPRPHHVVDIQPKEQTMAPPKPQQQTKDDAYSQFMREMEGLL